VISIGIATFIRVFLLAFQQQNVHHQYKWWAAFTSYGIALADVVVVLGVVDSGLAAVPFIGTGGAAGVVMAIIMHKRIRK